MSNSTLFNPVKEGHDGKNRVVFICQDAKGFYVYKPATGFKTKHWPKQDTKAVVNCFKRQVSCTQNNGFFEPGEAPSAEEVYFLEAEAKALPTKTPTAADVPVVITDPA
jgi:hypothetical protein